MALISQRVDGRHAMGDRRWRWNGHGVTSRATTKARIEATYVRKTSAENTQGIDWPESPI
jgi:hypothetical protein